MSNTIYTDFNDIVKSKKKYKIIYADPPWSYNDKLPDVRGAESHYNTMTMNDIYDLPVYDIADDDCILFLWGTWPLTKDVIQTLEKWEFDYKTCGFIWIKQSSTGKDFVGMGHYTRGNSEYCLIATKGHPKRIDASISQVIRTQIKEHSAKPDLVRKQIVKLCGDLPRIELFARTIINGWDVFGNDEKLKLKPLEAWG